jgi:ABC-type Fe3+-hydroxamate transport system substrate-binding protein
MKRISFVLAAIAVLALLAGCGGGGSSSSSSSQASSGGSSKAEYVKAADAVCTEYQGTTQPMREEVKEIEASSNPESPDNLKRLGQILQKADSTAEQEYEALHEVEAPSADQATIDAMIGKAEKAVGESRESAEALEAGDLTKFSQILKEAAPLNAQARKMAIAYGFKVCGQAESE